MSKGTWARNGVLNATLNGASFVVTTPYIALHSGDPGLAGANELSGGGYGRVNGSACFPDAAAGSCANDAVVTYGTATGDWTEATYFSVWDAPTGGNFVRGAVLTTPRTVLNGDTARFSVGALVFNET